MGDVTTPAFIRSHAEGVSLAIKLQPRASRTEIGPLEGPELKIKVTAPPVDAAANEALLALLAEKLGSARGAVVILRGKTSRHKTILVRGVTVEKVWSALQGSL